MKGGTWLGLGTPAGPIDLPEGGVFSMDFWATLLVELQATQGVS